MLPPAQSDIPPRTKRDKKCNLSIEASAVLVSGAEGVASLLAQMAKKNSKSSSYLSSSPFTLHG